MSVVGGKRRPPRGRVRPFFLRTPTLARGPAQAGPCGSRPKEDDSVWVVVRLRQAGQEACLCCGGVSGRSQPPLCQWPVWSSCLLGLLLAGVSICSQGGHERFSPDSPHMPLSIRKRPAGWRRPAHRDPSGSLTQLSSEHMQVSLRREKRPGKYGLAACPETRGHCPSHPWNAGGHLWRTPCTRDAGRIEKTDGLGADSRPAALQVGRRVWFSGGQLGWALSPEFE